MRGVLIALTFFVALSVSASAQSCEELSFDGAGFTVCTIDPTVTPIRVWHSDGKGRVLGSFERLSALLEGQGQILTLAMNGGMYHLDRAPVGLFIEDGVTVMRLVTSAGPGNFGLLPNGVFCVSDDGVAIVESRRFRDEGRQCRFATQSGPMLVIDGALHPRFIRDSNSRFVRNGVGVSADGKTVYFAISARGVNFHHFARLFRDYLGAPNALYLDGKVSRLYAPMIGRNDAGFAMGPIIGVAIDETDAGR